jgi:ABC-2 type transport system permease protein
MVAVLVQLKLHLLRNSLKRSVWRTVGLIIGMAYALAIVVFVLVGMVALRWTSVDTTADVTVLVYSVLTVGWLLFSLLVFGVDETVDPTKFALLPLRAREIRPGLFIAGFIGSPGVATVLVGLGLVITWARTLPLTLAALVAFPIGVATCFLFSRAGTAAFASFLGSRRFRDLAFVVLALFGIVMGIGGNLVGGLAGRDPAQMRGVLASAATLAGWSPFGWAWAVPAALARGEWWGAGLRLVLAVALAGALWWIWSFYLAQRLTSPIEAGGGAAKVRTGGFVDRLYPATPAGGVAVRTLHYWRRDPRYFAGIAGFSIAPIIIVVSTMINPYPGSTVVAALAPVLLALLLGMSVAQDLSYDGTAIWQHIVSGVRGADDRAGRVMSTATVFGPVLLILLLATAAVSGEWRLLPMIAGVSFGVSLIGLGVGSVVGALWQWPAPPPGANPFQKGNSGGLPSFLSFSASSIATFVLSLPLAALAVGSFWFDWLGWIALPLGLLFGYVLLRVGIAQGGKLLDRRWPEVMGAVSEKAA